jgi:DNA-binding transcriptional regulator PaaX
MNNKKIYSRSHKPQLKTLIIRKLSELGEGTLNALFPYRYPETRLWRKLLGLDPAYTFSKRTFSSILSQLRKDGLVEKQGDGRRHAVWKISAKGASSVKNQNLLGLKNDGIPRIVSYDIPEKNRRARYWLRACLFDHNYRQLHKSVWLGFTPLPEEFLKQLDALSLRDYIHMFSIGKKGTLQNH